jgi:hypothetical protein
MEKISKCIKKQTKLNFQSRKNKGKKGKSQKGLEFENNFFSEKIFNLI